MTSTRQRDELYRTPLADIGGFRFDEHVVDVFPDMLVRSIPGYRSIIAQSGLLAERFAQPETHCYDLGCSLGATLLAMRHAIGERNCQLVGIDNSSAMLDRCQELIVKDDQQWREAKTEITPTPVTLINADIANSKIEPASVVAMNFTLQFIEPENRDDLLSTIAAAIVKGGAFVLSEKVEFDDPVLNELYIDRYHAFKRANGYSELEVSQKRTALEKVLIPDTIDTHTRRLEKAGFSHCAVWFQCFNFISMIAVK